MADAPQSYKEVSDSGILGTPYLIIDIHLAHNIL
jgi:hypothetical protein